LLYPIMFSTFILNLQTLPGGMFEIEYEVTLVLLTRRFVIEEP
jgi:hypothetical protein